MSASPLQLYRPASTAPDQQTLVLVFSLALLCGYAETLVCKVTGGGTITCREGLDVCFRRTVYLTGDAITFRGCMFSKRCHAEHNCCNTDNCNA